MKKTIICSCADQVAVSVVAIQVPSGDPQCSKPDSAHLDSMCSTNAPRSRAGVTITSFPPVPCCCVSCRGVQMTPKTLVPDETASADPDNVPPRSRLFLVVPKTAEARLVHVSSRQQQQQQV
jgi:hypothetical protein